MRIFLGDFFVLISFIANDAHFIELRGYKKQNSAGKMEGDSKKSLRVYPGVNWCGRYCNCRGLTGEGLRPLFMMIITDIGHLEVLIDGRLRALKPTFQAMTRIGSPEQIVTVMATVYGSHYLTHNESSGQRRTLLLNMILSLSRTPAFDGPIRLVR